VKYETFQSLFWWIEGWDLADASVSYLRHVQFQSLFWWIEGWDAFRLTFANDGVYVSILVLVD